MVLARVPWDTQINFSSALLLHSCVTVLVKECLNTLAVLRRLAMRTIYSHKKGEITEKQKIQTSAILDAYTSILSKDDEGEQSELYFTNTGFVLLASTLAASIAMNLLLEDMVLDVLIAATFGIAWLASMVVVERKVLSPILALRRAARFIWSDTPFVNVFSLIYVALVLHGRARLRLRDYATLRGIAVAELVFMKGRLASSSVEQQLRLLRRLLESELVIISASLVSSSDTLIRFTKGLTGCRRSPPELFPTRWQGSIVMTYSLSRPCIASLRWQ